MVTHDIRSRRRLGDPVPFSPFPNPFALGKTQSDARGAARLVLKVVYLTSVVETDDSFRSNTYIALYVCV